MPKYYLTFGKSYDIETHPHVPTINPDGYVEVDAISELDARSKVFEIFGDKWAFLYSEKQFNPIYFPKGRIYTLDEIKSLDLETFYYKQKKEMEKISNPISIVSETEVSKSLNAKQMMIMNNLTHLLSTMTTFPRIDKYESYIDDFNQKIAYGLSKDNTLSDKDRKFCETLNKKINELVDTVKYL